MAFTNAAAAAAGGAGYIPNTLLGGKVRCAIAEFTLASDVAGVYTAPIRLPRGARVLALALNSDTSLGSTTLAVGIAGTAGKYRAAATYTSTDTLTFVALNAAIGKALAAEEQIIITTAAATAPSSGRLLIMFFYTDPS